MPPASSTLLILTGYRVAGMVVGLAIVYMGYRLFLSGFLAKAGELEVGLGEHKVKVRNATPGVFFGLFGAAVIATSLWKGFTLTTSAAGLTAVATDGILIGDRNYAAMASTDDSTFRARLREDSTAWEIARKAVAGETVSAEQRATFLRWYKSRHLTNFFIMGMTLDSSKQFTPKR